MTDPHTHAEAPHHEDGCNHNHGHSIGQTSSYTAVNSHEHESCCGAGQSVTVSSVATQKQKHDGCCGRDAGDFNFWQDLKSIVISAPLLLIGLMFNDALHNTPFSIAEYAVLLPAYLLCGWGVLTTAGRNILRGRIFDENFLMTIATLGAIVIHELPEAVGVMLFYQVGELVQGSVIAIR